MLTKYKLVIAALAFTAPVAIATPAQAQARGVGVISIDQAIQQTNAFRTAAQQIQTTYAAQIQQADTRAQALEAELAPLRTALQQAQQVPGATVDSVRPAAQALQTRQAAAQQELNQLQAPYLTALAYVREQVAVQVDAAVTAAMAASNVDLVLNPEAILKLAPNSSANITAAVTAQLDSRIASAQPTPPAGWQPGDTLRAAQPQQQQPAATEGR